MVFRKTEQFLHVSYVSVIGWVREKKAAKKLKRTAKVPQYEKDVLDLDKVCINKKRLRIKF